MKKCKKCGQKKGVHKMSCETQKKVLIVHDFINKEYEKHWGFGEESIFNMLNDIVNGKLK